MSRVVSKAIISIESGEELPQDERILPQRRYSDDRLHDASRLLSYETVELIIS